MSTRASRNRRAMVKLIVGNEGHNVEALPERRVEEERERKEMINDKDCTWENTLERMILKYVTEIEKLRVVIKKEGETWNVERENRRKNGKRRNNRKS